MGKAKRFLGTNLSRNDRLSKSLARQSNTLRSQNITPSSQTHGTPNNEFIKSTGGLHFGADGYISDALTIASGILDLKANAAGNIVKIRKNINISPETGTTDTLDLITAGGTEFPGQEMRLIGQAGNTITITHNSGSAAGNNKAILCPNDTSYSLVNDNTVTLYYDDTLGAWSIDGDSVAGGGGGLSEPLLQTITAVSPQTEPTTTDIDCSIGNVYTIALDRAVTMDFTNETASKYQLIHLIFTQDATGSRVVTWPASLTATPTVNQTALAQTDIVLYTLDQGTTWNYVVGSAGSTAAGASKALDNLVSPVLNTGIDANNTDFTTLRNLRFGTNGQSHDTEPHIFADASGDMVFNVATGDSFFTTVNGVVIGQRSLDELEIRTVTEHGPTLRLNNNDSTTNTANDQVADIIFQGNDDAAGNVNYGAIEVEMEDVTAGATQGSFKLHCMSDNTLQPITDFSGSDAVFRFSSGVDVVRPNRDNGIDLGAVAQSWANFFIAGYEDVKGIAVPANPAAGTRRIFTDTADGVLKVRTSAGTTISLEGGGLGAHNILDSTSHSDSTTGTVARGDLITGQGVTPTWTRLAKGTANQVLTMDGTGTDIVWAAASSGDNLGDHTATTDLDLAANDLIYSGTTKVQVVGSTVISLSSGTEIFRYNTSSFRTTVKMDLQDNELILDEMGTAPTGISNAVSIYAEDNGAGKTRLMAIFPTGSAQQIAIEP